MGGKLPVLFRQHKEQRFLGVFVCVVVVLTLCLFVTRGAVFFDCLSDRHVLGRFLIT